MRPSVIGRTDARILVAATDGSATLFDRTEPGREFDDESSRAPAYVRLDDGDDLLTALPPDPTRVVLVAGPAAAARARGSGWTAPIVVEVTLHDGAVAELAALRRTEALVGIAVPVAPHPEAMSASPGRVRTDAVEQGRVLGVLSSILLAGVATVRTDDPTAARRVRAVIGALIEPADGDARMAP